jgi:hypothetical protein
VSRFAESGLTLREYCARERISTTSFYRARRVYGVLSVAVRKWVWLSTAGAEAEMRDSIGA